MWTNSPRQFSPNISNITISVLLLGNSICMGLTKWGNLNAIMFMLMPILLETEKISFLELKEKSEIDKNWIK